MSGSRAPAFRRTPCGTVRILWLTCEKGAICLARPSSGEQVWDGVPFRRPPSPKVVNATTRRHPSARTTAGQERGDHRTSRGQRCSQRREAGADKVCGRRGHGIRCGSSPPAGLLSDLPCVADELARYPSPADANGLGEKRLAGFLKIHGYSSRKTPAQLLERWRSAPAGRGGPVENRTRRSIVLRLTQTLQTIVEQIRKLESEMAEALDAHPDGEIFRSFFVTRSSVICAATLLSEIADCRARYPHRDAIAAQAGHAPVAVESGKRKNAKFRWACNKRLRRALDTVAMSTARWNPWAADRYAQARQRGHNHRRALRTVGRTWSRILWRCWQTRTPNDPQRHAGLQQHITITIPSPGRPVTDVAATQRMAGAAITSALHGPSTYRSTPSLQPLLSTGG